MKRSLWILLFLFSASSLWADMTLEQQADAAWAARADATQTQKAYTLWVQALKENPTHTSLWISVTRAGARITRHTDNKDEKKQWAERTREAAQKAVQQNPQSSEAYAYLGEALGQWADADKGLGSLKCVRQAVDALKQAITLDPKNYHAHMLLSEFYRQAPSGISVGDKDKALAEAKLAVETGPHYAISHLALAEIHIDRGDKALAVAELQHLLALPAPIDAIPETKADQETAQGLLMKLGASPDAASTAAPAIAVDAASGVCSESQSVSVGCQTKKP